MDAWKTICCPIFNTDALPQKRTLETLNSQPFNVQTTSNNLPACFLWGCCVSIPSFFCSPFLQLTTCFGFFSERIMFSSTGWPLFSWLHCFCHVLFFQLSLRQALHQYLPNFDMLHNIDSQKVAQSDFLCEECVSGDRTSVTHCDVFAFSKKMLGEGNGKGGKVFFCWGVCCFEKGVTTRCNNHNNHHKSNKGYFTRVK